MKFFIDSENGSGMKCFAKTDFLAEVARMIEDCIANGGTEFSLSVYADAPCFSLEEDARLTYHD